MSIVTAILVGIFVGTVHYFKGEAKAAKEKEKEGKDVGTSS